MSAPKISEGDRFGRRTFCLASGNVFGEFSNWLIADVYCWVWSSPAVGLSTLPLISDQIGGRIVALLVRSSYMPDFLRLALVLENALGRPLVFSISFGCPLATAHHRSAWQRPPRLPAYQSRTPRSRYRRCAVRT
jgi:hypothetical protein